MATIYEERTPSQIVIQYLFGRMEYAQLSDTPQQPTPTTGQIHPRY